MFKNKIKVAHMQIFILLFHNAIFRMRGINFENVLDG